MKDFKIHIAKQIVKGKVMTTITECGRRAYTKNGAVNMIFKTSEFKLAYQNNDNLCIVCLNKAKEQERV